MKSPYLTLIGSVILMAGCVSPATSSLRSPDEQAKVAVMVAKGLDYLVSRQDDTGIIQLPVQNDLPDRSVELTALTVLAIHAHEEEPMKGVYGREFALGILGLISAQTPNGMIGGDHYTHCLATMALAKATPHVPTDHVIQASREATQLLLNQQFKNRSMAWGPNGCMEDADVVHTVQALYALLAARAVGRSVPEEAIRNGLIFLRQCQMPNGGVAETLFDRETSVQSTGLVLLAFAAAGKTDSPVYQAAARYLAQTERPKSQHNSIASEYFLYQQIFLLNRLEWEKWDAALIGNLNQCQRDNGEIDVSFHRFVTKTEGVTLDTAYALLALSPMTTVETQVGRQEILVRQLLRKPRGPITAADVGRVMMIYAKRVRQMAAEQNEISEFHINNIAQLLGRSRNQLPPEYAQDLKRLEQAQFDRAAMLMDMWLQARWLAGRKDSQVLREFAQTVSRQQIIMKLSNHSKKIGQVRVEPAVTGSRELRTELNGLAKLLAVVP